MAVRFHTCAYTSHPLDEQTLWNHLQSGEFERAIEVIDWYYSRSNPEGFDDPKGITKAEHLEPTDKIPTDLTAEHRIRKRRNVLRSTFNCYGCLCSFLCVPFI